VAPLMQVPTPALTFRVPLKVLLMPVFKAPSKVLVVLSMPVLMQGLTLRHPQRLLRQTLQHVD
jgi:hypothetical protein